MRSSEGFGWLMKKYLWLTLMCAVICYLFSTTLLAESRESYGKPVETYVGAQGVRIVSFSELWNTQEKLKKVYEELLKNVHGDELRFLSDVYLYPDSPDGVASYYHDEYSVYNDIINYQTSCYIEIFNCDRYVDISYLARYLAHEYGHHFTFYYMTTYFNVLRSDWINTEYSIIRSLEDYGVVTYIGDITKPYQYEWDIAEIIANDYVQLYGSELARVRIDYLDVKERIEQSVVEPYLYDFSVFNLLPQENMALPLATDVVGLYDFFYKISGVLPIANNEGIKVPVPTLKEIINVHENFNQYVFTWETQNTDNYIYTLLMNSYANKAYPIPIRTVSNQEENEARAGSAVNYNENIAILENLYGDFQVRILLEDQDGLIHSSEAKYLEITHEMNSVIKYSDLTKEHWAKSSIYDMSNRGIINGYEDHTFRPDQIMSRAEFMTCLVRSYKSELKIKDDGEDWFAQMGYYEAAVVLGLQDGTETSEYYNVAITREAMADMIYKMLMNKGYTIDKADQEELTAIEIIVDKGIIEDNSNGVIEPSTSSTRAEAMTIISKYLELVEGVR